MWCVWLQPAVEDVEIPFKGFMKYWGMVFLVATSLVAVLLKQ
jgi:hypothetical protein